jgi:hypothetical protein
MQLDEKTIIFSTEPDAISVSEMDAIKSHWNKLEVAQVSSNPSAEQILDAVLKPETRIVAGQWFSFSDQGVQVEIRAKWTIEKQAEIGKPSDRLFILPIDNQDELTSPSIRHYLHQHNVIIKNFFKNPQAVDQKIKTDKIDYSAQDIPVIVFSDCRAYVNDFLKAIGYSYTENVSIMFPYAGIQVQASSNLIQTPDGKEVLVDFGDLYGDAVQSIEKTGFKIIQIQEKDDLLSVTVKLLEAVRTSYTMNPVFSAAKRHGIYHTRLTIPGFLVEKGGKSKILLASVPLHGRIIQFLQEQGIVIVRIESNE